MGSEDTTWLTLVTRSGLVVLTWDKRIRYRRAEINAALSAGGRVLFFTGGNQRMWDRLDTVVRAWPVIDQRPALSGPWAKAYASGRLRDLRGTRD